MKTPLSKLKTLVKVSRPYLLWVHWSSENKHFVHNGNNFVSSGLSGKGSFVVITFSDRFDIEKNSFNISNNKKKLPREKNIEEETLGMQGAFHLNGKNALKRFVVELSFFVHTN